MSTNWIELRSFSNIIEAEVAKSALESLEIKSQTQVVDTNGIGSLGGLYPSLLMTRLLVLEEHAEQAKKILQSLENK